MEKDLRDLNAPQTVSLDAVCAVLKMERSRNKRDNVCKLLSQCVGSKPNTVGYAIEQLSFFECTQASTVVVFDDLSMKNSNNDSVDAKVYINKEVFENNRKEILRRLSSYSCEFFVTQSSVDEENYAGLEYRIWSPAINKSSDHNELGIVFGLLLILTLLLGIIYGLFRTLTD